MEMLHPQIAPILDRFLERVSTLPSDERVRIFHHGDPDGACAAASFTHLLTASAQSSRISVRWLATHQFDFQDIEAFLTSNSGYSVFCFDINFSSRSDFLSFLLQHRDNDIVVVDDHILNFREEDVDRILYNPNVKSKVPFDFAPTIFLYLAARRLGVSLPSWLPALGLLSDRQLDAHRSLIDGYIPPEQELHEAIVQLSSFYLDPTSRNDNNAPLNHLISHLSSDSDWNSFIQATRNHEILVRSRQRVDASIAQDLRDILSFGPIRYIKEIPLRVFRQESAFPTTNILASRLRNEFNDSLVFVYRCDGTHCYFEIRAGNKVIDCDIVSVLRRVSSEVKLRNYGGHRRAAGGACEQTNFDLMVRSYVETSRRAA